MKKSIVFALWCLCLLCSGVQARTAGGKLRVLTITGDWKTQPWYQDVWMGGKGEKLFRGRFIAREVERAAPGKFAFTDITNATAQQYGDEAYFKQFDVILVSDIVGFSLPTHFLSGLQNYVRGGGGFVYAASWKWETALLDNSPFEAVLPARFGVDSSKDDWKNLKTRLDAKDFKPVVSAPNHPVVQGLDWNAIPTLDGAFRILPKSGAQVLLKTPDGAPILAAWDVGAGRSAISSSIGSNDDLSSKIGDWKDFGRYYAQLFSWLGAKSPYRSSALRDATAQVTVDVNAARSSNEVTAKAFGIHASHDDPGLAPLQGEALKNFRALHLEGAFSRLGAGDFEPQNDNDDPNTFNWKAFHFEQLDGQLAEIKRLNLEPLMLFDDLNNGRPDWLWKSTNSSWFDASPAAIAEAAEHVAAVVEHVNGGKGTDPNYKLNLRYIEIANEPDLNSKTIPGFARLFKGVAQRIHRDYPGVQVGTFGAYEIPYLPQFLEAVNPDLDWVSRHPYGWTGERVFEEQDAVAAYQKEHHLRPVPFIITEWDFWIQGREKFDYMMQRNFQAVRRDNLIGTLHYRLGQYAEPVYLFGVLWTGANRERGAGEKGTPMHDAYDAFWLWRDFRGHRVAVNETAGQNTPAQLLEHLHADATREGDRLGVVLYSDWAYDGTGFKDYGRGVNYSQTRVHLRLALPPSTRTRTLTLSRATGTGFDIVGAPIQIPAGQKQLEQTVDIGPMTGWSLTVQ